MDKDRYIDHARERERYGEIGIVMDMTADGRS
jgi:hypothetical protein